MTGHYHSAHAANHAPASAAPVDAWRGADGSTALQFDVTAGPLPPQYDACDVFYADLPWARGQAIFNARAGVVATHSELLDAVAAIVTGDAPAYLVLGRQDLRRLPCPRATLPVRLNRYAAVAAAWVPASDAERFATARPATDIELIRCLADWHDCVGDFFCGYGRTARIFAEAGKQFVVSDYNARCVGYIAASAAG
jgi:hypothetical protein